MARYREQSIQSRRPFWLPASNYYVLTAAAAIAVFFLVWGILNDGIERTPWIPAGVAASIVLALAAFMREVILRRARMRFLTSQQQLDNTLRLARANVGRRQDGADKLTLERNAAILREIRKKSDAAKVLGKFSAGHKEVFELCGEYLAAAARELPKVGVGSPRLAALKKGSTAAGEYHRYHLIKWAEIETRSLSHEAKNRVKISEKLEIARQAIDVVDFALRLYPQETDLIDSKHVLEDFVSSVKVADWIEKAERASFKGNTKRALDFYQDALFDLERGGPLSGDRKLIAEKIQAEIERLGGQLLGGIEEK